MTVATLDKIERMDQHKKASVEADELDCLTSENCQVPDLSTNWLIKDVLALSGLGVVYGRPGSGKSAVVLDMMLTIARGERDWRGHRTRLGQVTYVASEGGSKAAGNRVHAWLAENGGKWPKNFRISPKTFDLRSSDADVHKIARYINAYQPGEGVIVIDTLNRNMAGGNENSPDDMGAFIINCGLLAQLTGKLVLVIHHCGKDEAKGSRGHSSLLGAVDFEGEVSRPQDPPGATGTFRVTKQREGEDGAKFGFQLIAKELGQDDDGDPVKAVVAIEADTPETKSRSKLDAASTIAFELLTRAIADGGEIPPTSNHIPPDKRCVSENLWRRYCYAGQITESDKQETKQKTFKRAADRLQKAGLIGVWQEWAWLT